MEILAPVGGQEQLIAAVRNGANAVYLGTKDFNARRNADNFDDTSLIKAVEYCHARGVKVYVALNTVITDNEFTQAVNTVKSVANAKVDAVIIQDLAVLNIVKTVCPDMPRHASTQMSIHNADGAKMLERLGFTRVVPARELSLEELKIIRMNTSLELEVFVHGALCMSVSGQCYLSSILGCRSANRGLCAQPCRLDFKYGEKSHALSLKDLCAVDMLSELEKIGINSAKIEGRMKRPEYVAEAVKACKNSLRGDEVDYKKLQAIFSRSGFTKGYLTAKRTPDMFGYRTKEDVVSAAPVLKEIANGYRNELPLVAVDMQMSVKKDCEMKLTVTDGKNSVTVMGAVAEPASSKPADADSVTRSLIKCGGTHYFVNKVTAEVDDGLFVAASAVNEMRKNALMLITKKRTEREGYVVNDYAIPAFDNVHVGGDPLLYARFEKLSQVVEGYDKMIIDYNELYSDKEFCRQHGNRLIAELPALMFSRGSVLERLSELKRLGIDTVYAPNLYAINVAKELGFKIMGGFGLNINNSIALYEYARLGVESTEISFECSLERFDKMKKPIPCGLMIYGKMPLMTFRACPVKSENGCADCNGRQKLVDRMGIEMTVLCKDKKYSRLLNPQPIYMGDKLPQFKNASFCVVYFTDESKKECEGITRLIKSKGGFRGKFTRGLYYKEIK